VQCDPSAVVIASEPGASMSSMPADIAQKRTDPPFASLAFAPTIAL
jgi:hypothetical protein